jgi:hypothetical protein
MSREQRAPDQDHDRDRAPARDDGDHKAAAASVESSETAVNAIWDFATTGKGKAKDMPRLMSRLDDTGKGEVRLLFPQLADRMSGALFLECCSVFQYEPLRAVPLALERAKPAASGGEIRAYLRLLDEDALMALEEDEPLITQLRTLMPLALSRELPKLDLRTDLIRKPNLLKWYIDSSPAEVVALEIAEVGGSVIAETLDKIDRWGWLDDFHVGAKNYPQLHALRAATTNAKAKARLDTILEGIPADTTNDSAIVADAKAKLTQNINDPAFTDEEMLETTARARKTEGLPMEEMRGRMKGKPVADVLQFVSAVRLSSAEAMEMVLDAPGAGYEHVIAVFRIAWMDDAAPKTILTNTKLLSKLRSAIGSKTTLFELFPSSITLEKMHSWVVEDEALIAWVLEMKAPRDSLWIAAGSIAGEKRGLRAVKDDRGLDWVMKLPYDVPQRQLRRLSLALSGKYKKHVDKMIGDEPSGYEKGDWETEESDEAIKNKDDRAQFSTATYSDEVSEEDFMKRLSDLEPDDRAKVAKNPTHLEWALKKATGDNVVRVVYQLQPTISALLGTKLGAEPRLLSYVHSRPASDQIDAASSAAVTTRAAEVFDRSPFVILPALLDPNALARALGKNPKLLTWIFEAAEPNQALSVLSRDPVKAKVVEAWESTGEPMSKFPLYKHLRPEGKAGIDAIGKNVTDGETRDQVKDYQAGKGEQPEAEVAKDGEHLHEAAEAEHLWHAIKALKQPDPNTLMALVRAYPKDHHSILAGNHEAAVKILRENTGVGPQIVFPEITPMQLIAYPNARNWLLECEAPFVVLHIIAKDPGALKYLGKQIDGADAGIASWIAKLPRGAGLDALEREVLDKLRAHLQTDTGIRTMFSVRFDVAIEDTYDRKLTNDLWNTLRRLPPAQVDQKVIEEFRREDLGSTVGHWAKPDIVMNSDDGQLEGKDESYDNTPELTKEQIMSYYGLDEAGFEKAIDKKHGFIEAVGDKFKVKKVEMEQFASTVLHEVGHSIDTLLGRRTELVFGIAGWKNFGVDQVEDWAAELGALEGLHGKTKEKVLEAWRQALRSQTKVSELVTSDHPAIDPELAKKAPLVQAGIDGSIFHHKEKRQVGDKVGVTGTNQGTIGVVPLSTADVAPSSYALSAPGEFFAECYVEYYRDYNGTANTKDKKGGRLPPAYRKWMDDNVDKIELNPQRYVKDDDGA